MPKHLILDIGKVLVTYKNNADDGHLFFYLQQKEPFALEEAKEYLYKHYRPLEIGTITLTQFMRQFNRQFSTHFTTKDFFYAKKRNCNFNKELVTYCKKHKKQFDTSILSGNNKALLDWYAQQFHFSIWTKARVYSYQHGMNKENPKIFHVLLQKLHAKPQDCVFVDDQKHYTSVAKSIGMHAITYNGNNKTLFLQLDKIFTSSATTRIMTKKKAR
jgi:FMN phosphatase YigB (HAD superfamily)